MLTPSPLLKAGNKSVLQLLGGSVVETIVALAVEHFCADLCNFLRFHQCIYFFQLEYSFSCWCHSHAHERTTIYCAPMAKFIIPRLLLPFPVALVLRRKVKNKISGCKLRRTNALGTLLVPVGAYCLEPRRQHSMRARHLLASLLGVAYTGFEMNAHPLIYSQFYRSYG